MKILVLLISFYSLTVWGVESDLCDILDIPNCRGITKQLRRNTFQSAPTSSTAAVLNPSNVRFDKGLGLEAIAQANNTVVFGLATGTGKMGGALISGSLDNTFFGNRVPEHDENILERQTNYKQFDNQKDTLALGAKIFSGRNAGLDIGIITKRHHEIRSLNLGAGISARLGPFHFGASSFKDDYVLSNEVISRETGTTYSNLFGFDEFRESFSVTTYTAGVRIKNFALDLATINSELDYYKSQHGVPETRILVYAASYYYRDLLLNAAIRKEHSGARVLEGSDTVVRKVDKTAPFFSVQYSVGKHFVLGVMYNYFLLEEVAGSLTIFI